MGMDGRNIGGIELGWDLFVTDEGSERVCGSRWVVVREEVE